MLYNLLIDKRGYADAMTRRNERGFQKKLTSNDYQRLANSLASQTIPNMASWLPQRIDKIHELYLALREKNPEAVPITLPNHTWKELDKIRSHVTHKTNHNSFLNQDEHYRACCNLVANTVKLLEKILLDSLNVWQKPEKLLNRRKPTECLIKKINNQDDYLFIQMVALTLKEIYQQFPDQDELLFQNKKDLSFLIENIKPETEQVSRFQKGQ